MILKSGNRFSDKIMFVRNLMILKNKKAKSVGRP